MADMENGAIYLNTLERFGYGKRLSGEEARLLCGAELPGGKTPLDKAIKAVRPPTREEFRGRRVLVLGDSILNFKKRDKKNNKK